MDRGSVVRNELQPPAISRARARNRHATDEPLGRRSSALVPVASPSSTSDQSPVPRRRSSSVRARPEVASRAANRTRTGIRGSRRARVAPSTKRSDGTPTTGARGVQHDPVAERRRPVAGADRAAGRTPVWPHPRRCHPGRDPSAASPGRSGTAAPRRRLSSPLRTRGGVGDTHPGDTAGRILPRDVQRLGPSAGELVAGADAHGAGRRRPHPARSGRCARRRCTSRGCRRCVSVPMRNRMRTSRPAQSDRSTRDAPQPRDTATNARRPWSGLPRRIAIVPV